MIKQKKTIKVILLVFLLLFVGGCSILDFFKTDEVEITVKQAIILPTGTIIEASAPLNVTKILDSFLPKVGDIRVKEHSMFVIPVEIKNSANMDFINTKLKFSYEEQFIDYLYLYSSSKQPLVKIDNKIYDFDKDLKSSQTTKLFIAGKVNNITKGLEDGRVKFSLSLLDDSNNTISIEEDTIVIFKEEKIPGVNLPQ